MSHLLHHICQIAADIFDVTMEDLTAVSSPETVASWDSLQHLNLIVALEQAFGVEFTPEEIERTMSLEAIVEVLGAKQPGEGAGPRAGAVIV